jgi:hypothetical protein
LNRADVFVGGQPCHEVSRLQRSVDVDEGIAIRFKAELKVERLGQMLQDIREVRVTRDEMHHGSTVATADADLLGERQWTGEQHCPDKRGAHSAIQRRTPAAATQRQSTSIAMDARVDKPRLRRKLSFSLNQANHGRTLQRSARRAVNLHSQTQLLRRIVAGAVDEYQRNRRWTLTTLASSVDPAASSSRGTATRRW